ncbi:MAG TPA: glycosyltransferase family 4 protein [Opitutaceae bacterium]|nr:glycosyltransferase family 4 protein [Opitutaceae bacterium]
MILFSHPTGNANVRHAALGLHHAGLLGEFWTCINHRPESLFSKMLPASLVKQFSRRSFPPELQPLMRSYPYFELGRLLAPRLKLGRLTRHEHGALSVDAVYRALDRRVARRLRETDRFTGVYAYEDGAAWTFREARRRGLPCLYDQPIGYWRAARDILVEEAERLPEWASTLIGNDDTKEKTDRKDEEIALADVVYAASSYTQRTLQQAPGLKARVIVIPYGAPQRASSVAPLRAPRVSGSPLRVIFVGSLGQRKGLSYLFEACRQLGRQVELTIIGTLPLERCAALEKELKAVRWIPTCPHAQVLQEMAGHDVFLFPSLFEGFGLVLLEAMAMGLPIITTPNTAGPDLIDDGVEGFIVPIRSSAGIAEKLQLLRDEPDRLGAMGEAAKKRAATFTWATYGERLAQSVREACQMSGQSGLVSR